VELTNAAFRRGLSEVGYIEGRNVTAMRMRTFTWNDCRPWPRIWFAAR
jgi:hypothetical protein